MQGNIYMREQERCKTDQSNELNRIIIMNLNLNKKKSYIHEFLFEYEIGVEKKTTLLLFTQSHVHQA